MGRRLDLGKKASLTDTKFVLLVDNQKSDWWKAVMMVNSRVSGNNNSVGRQTGEIRLD